MLSTPTPVLLPGKSHGWRGLIGCSPWGCEKSDLTERLHFHFSLSCIGEGNGNPLQCSCLENPRDGVVWWAAVYGVAQSRTQLKQLSSSSSSRAIRLDSSTQKTRHFPFFSAVAFMRKAKLKIYSVHLQYMSSGTCSLSFTQKTLGL